MWGLPQQAPQSDLQHRAYALHDLQQRSKELYRESEREHHALPIVPLVGEDCAVSSNQLLLEQTTAMPLALGQHWWWEWPLARRTELLQQGTTLLGLDVGADPKAPAFRTWVACVKCVIADQFWCLPHHACNGRVARDTTLDSLIVFCVLFRSGCAGGLRPMPFHMAREYGLDVRLLGTLQKQAPPLAGMGPSNLGQHMGATSRRGCQGLR